MKVVILCGGRGTRINEKSNRLPKPMLEIGPKPILWNIMKTYLSYGFDEFILCLGYRGEAIANYDWSDENWKIIFADTGLKTGTAGRVKKIHDLIDGDRFFLTYGDGLSDVNISKCLDFHLQKGKTATVTAVRPLVRFGLLDLEGVEIRRFSKYSAPQKGWIDGGFFVLEKSFFHYLNNTTNEEMLEGPVLEKLASDRQFVAFKHDGYWKCIDTYRDWLDVKTDISTGNDKWRVWD